MSRTGETKKLNSFVKILKFCCFEMSYLYMTRNYRGCRFDLKMPLSQYLQWLWSYEKISFRAEGDYIPYSPSYTLKGLRKHCLAET